MSSLASGDNAEPNLVPILDMVFQLITFFMLVMNFKSQALDQNLVLPVVGSAAPVEQKDSDANTMVLNINSEGVLKVSGTEPSDVPAYVAEEGRIALMAAQRVNPAFKPGDDLPVTIVIRADKDTRFHLLYRIIKLFQQQGFRSFQYMTQLQEAE